MMKTFKVPKLSPSAQAHRDRRNELLENVKGQSLKQSRKALKDEFSIKVYTQEEIEAFVKERPDLVTKKIIGHSVWNTLTPTY